MKNSIVELMAVKSTPNENLFDVIEVAGRLECYAEFKSVKYTEFYQAVRAGMSAQYVISINLDDYQTFMRETKLRPTHILYHDDDLDVDVTYGIIRIYEKDTKLDITVQEVEGYGGF